MGGVIVARLLDPAGKGQLTYYIQLSALIVAFSSAGLSPAATVLLSQAKESTRAAVAGASVRIALLMNVPGVVASVTIAIALVNGSIINKLTLAALFILICALTTLTIVASSDLRARGKIARLNVSFLVLPFTYIVAILIVYVLGNHAVTVIGAVVANAVGTAAAAAYTLSAAGTYRYLRVATTTAELRRFRSFIRRSYIGNAVSIDGLGLDVLMLGLFSTKYSLGIYSVGLAATSLVRFQVTAANIILLPMAARTDLSDRRLWLGVSAISATAFASALIALPLANFAIPLVYGPQYEVPLIVLAGQLLTAFLSITRLCLGDIWRGMNQPAIASVCEVLLVALAIPLYAIFTRVGLVAVVTVSSALQLIGITFFLLMARRQISRKFRQTTLIEVPDSD